MRILIVDDDPFLLKLLNIQLRSFRLQQRGIDEVLACESAQSALDLLFEEDHGIGLLFCDLKMPGIDGVEFLRHLAELNYRGGVVLVSGEGAQTLRTVEQLGKARGLRVLGAFEKPITPDRLQALLDSAPWDAVGPESAPPQLDAARLRTLIIEQQVQVLYQPVVAVDSGEIQGFEALARLPRADGSLIEPAGFLASVAQERLSEALDWQVIQRAVSDHGTLAARAPQAYVSVNITHPAGMTLDFPDRLCALLEATALLPSHLRLEFSESGVADDAASHRDVLARLSLKGIGLCLDQFGTGYSSLIQLRDLPFNEVKIDRGFVHGASKTSQSASILDASVALARELGLHATAVGVEDEDDWRSVRSAGCTAAQGFLLGYPMTAAHAESWSQTWHPRFIRLDAI